MDTLIISALTSSERSECKMWKIQGFNRCLSKEEHKTTDKYSLTTILKENSYPPDNEILVSIKVILPLLLSTSDNPPYRKLAGKSGFEVL